MPFRYLPLVFFVVIFGKVFGQSQQASIKIGKQVFHIALDSCVLQFKKSNSKTKMEIKENYFSFELKDIDYDGHKDILAEIGGSNIPAMYDMFKYDPSSTWFRTVKGFNRFPDPKPISKTKYYYSYHKNGCADACWESDLFYVKDYKAIRVANIDCEFSEADNGAISIYKLIRGKRKLVKTLPPDVGDKWVFIKKYWHKHYKRFI